MCSVMEQTKPNQGKAVNPTNFPEATIVLGKPPGMTDDQCASLPIHHDKKNSALISRWLPTPAEREAIAAGKPVWLWIYGNGHPPVALTTERPFK